MGAGQGDIRVIALTRILGAGRGLRSAARFLCARDRGASLPPATAGAQPRRAEGFGYRTGAGLGRDGREPGDLEPEIDFVFFKRIPPQGDGVAVSDAA